mgnify:CR=1 FL=1|tara:strand:+ start:99 stop:896 length:798 start_codon:yes stop_codon:yes gene_type:complete
MVLQEVIDAVESFPKPGTRTFQSYTGADLVSESRFTREISERLSASSSTRRIWTANDNHQYIPNANPERSFHSEFFLGHSEIDISWADGLESSRPEALLEVKLRSSARASQDHYMFLAETAAVAADFWLCEQQGRPISGYCVFIAGANERTRTDWLSVLASRERMIIEINPTLASNQGQPNPLHTPYWVNKKTGLIRPDFRSGINKILAGNTSTHYSGIYRRHGTFRVEVIATHNSTSNGHWILQYEIVSVAMLPGTTNLQLWWP